MAEWGPGSGIHCKEDSTRFTDELDVGCERNQGWHWVLCPEQLKEWRPRLLRWEELKEEQMAGRQSNVSFRTGFEMSNRAPSGDVKITWMHEEFWEEHYLRNTNWANAITCKSQKHILSYISLLLLFWVISTETLSPDGTYIKYSTSYNAAWYWILRSFIAVFKTWCRKTKG